MDSVRVVSNYGRGHSVRNLLDNASHSVPTPTMNRCENFNIASGRAAQVLRQLKQSPSPNITKALSENQLLIRCATTPWYKYIVEFQRVISSRTTRFHIMNQLLGTMGDSKMLYDGQFLHAPHQLSKEHFLYDDPSLGCSNEGHIRFLDTINIEQLPINLINILFRLAIDQGQELGLGAAQPSAPRSKTRSWNGSIVHVARSEDGLVLTIDFPSKSTASCYEELERAYMSTCNGNYQNYARRELINKLVLTRYDNRTQRIDNIDFDLTPATLTLHDDSHTTLVDYYLNKFDISIQDPNQPLIIHYPRRSGDNTMNLEANYLVPELCSLTGLSDHAHRDARARHTNKILQLDSTGRQTEMIFFDDMVRRNAATVQYLAQWSIDVVANIVPTFVSNTESGPLRLNTGENVDLVLNDDEDEHEHGELQESPRYFGHFTHPVELKCWLLIYSIVDADRASIYVNMLRRVGQQHGMLINEPIHVHMDDDETETYASTLRAYLSSRIQLVSIIVKSRRVDRYNTIKRICCIEIPTPSEIVLRSTITDDAYLPSVALNIIRDITLKLGGQIRPNNMSMVNVMVIGLSTWTSASVNYTSPEHLDYVLAVVGTLNSNMTEYFSHAKSYAREDGLRSDVGTFVRLAIKAYYDQNRIYPATIIIGRNVFSAFDDLKLIKENEIQAILDTITDKSTMGEYNPRLIFFTFMKQTICDFHRYVQPSKIVNTDCVLAKDSPSYCFYLSSYRDRCSTLQARQFLVLFDNTDLSAQKIQQLVLYLCHHIPKRNHFFIPSMCRFSQRLSSLVGENLGASPRYEHRKTLFYM